MGTLTQTQLTQRAALYAKWQTLDTAISNAIASGVTSVNVSTGTGSKSFTKISLSDLRKERAAIATQIAEIDSNGRPAIKRFGIRFH